MTTYSNFSVFCDYLPDGTPALCLKSRSWADKLPRFVLPNSIASKRKVFAITMETAHEYVKCGKSGAPSIELMKKAHLIAHILGIDNDKWTIFNIINAVIDGIQDLSLMKPRDESKDRFIKQAEKDAVVIKIGDKTVLDAS